MISSSAGVDFAYRDMLLVRLVRFLPAVCLSLAVLTAVIRYPVMNWPLAVALATYSALLWYRPVICFLVIPVVLPNLDLGIWTGWTMVEESDLFIAMTVAILLVRTRPILVDFVPRSICGLAVGAFSTCWLIATMIGVSSTFGAPHSDNFLLRPDNAIRITKSLVEALALLPFLRLRQRLHGDVVTWLGWGFAAGLPVTMLIVMAERALFTNLLDFSATYRVVGPFSSMRVGGGHIGTYAALAAPFALSLFQLRSRSLTIILVAFDCVCGAYTVAVTFARTAYAAAAASMTTAAVGWIFAARQRGNWRFRLGIIPIGLVLSMLYLTATSTGMAGRFATVSSDFLIRRDNWEAGLAVRDRAASVMLFGMGIGTYQRAMLMRSVVNRPSDLALTEEDQGIHVTIRSETPLYFGQKISLPDVGPVHLTLWARADHEKTVLSVALCDKVLLYSDNCRGTDVPLSKVNRWTLIKADIATSGLGSHVMSGLLRRPVELSFSSSIGRSIDLRAISLTDDAGYPCLANGDFTQNLDRWIFTDDGHIAWRMKNQYLMLFFEVGLFGLIAYMGLVGLAFAGSIRAIKAGMVMGAPVAGALVSFIISGTFDNVLEAPRLATLFFLICWCGLIQWEAGSQRLVSAH